MRYDFGSDNTAGMAPSAVDGLVRANEAFARAYGADEITARAGALMNEVHSLAGAYGWSETQILALPAVRRYRQGSQGKVS